jgi:SAM-dependent methyltransferase
MLRDLLACPVCHGALDGVVCTACGREYRDDGVLDLTPIPPPDPAVASRWHVWEQLQANGERVYGDDPDHNLSVGDREDARAFGVFSELEGRVLDVGCGPQARPSYAAQAELVGIDPLAGEQPRQFAFVKGIAEFLPFRNATFDRVLFATSLDHMLSPERAVVEARRVVKPGGSVCVWHGEVLPLPPPPPGPSLASRVRRAAQLLRRGDISTIVGRLRPAPPPAPAPPAPSPPLFDVPAGAVDAFHFAHPDTETVVSWLTDAGLVIDRNERDAIGNRFIRARRTG